MPLKVRVEDLGEGRYIISPEGSIDANTYSLVGDEVDRILEKSPRQIIFDMKDVHFVSSAGISVVLIAEQSLKLEGGSALIVHLQPQVKKVFDIVQALPSQQIFASIEEMDRYLKAIQTKIRDGESS